MTWTRTASQALDLTPDAVWQVVGDPTLIPTWTDDWADVEVEGAPRLGATGQLLPMGLARSAVHNKVLPPFRITEYEPGRSLVIEQAQPRGRWRFRFTITPTDDGCVLTQRNEYDGVLTKANAALIGDDLADFGQRCVRLRAMTGARPRTDGLRVVIAGGAGLLGRHLAADLVCRGHQVVILTRTEDARLPFLQREWDGRTVGDWNHALFDQPGETAVVNLAGKLVGALPTRANIAEFTASRVEPTRALLEAVGAQPSGPGEPPQTGSSDTGSADTGPRRLAHWLQSSTTAIWGDAGELHCTESTPLPYGPAALPQMTGVARAWEAAFTDVPAEHSVVLRTSMVLSRDAPLVTRLRRFAELGVGGRMGTGRQWVSWIHLTDWLRIARAALGLEPGLDLPTGVLVGAAPHPVRNSDLMAAIRQLQHRPSAPPTPTPVATLGAWLMGTDPALGLTGRHATSQVLADQGFEFAFPTITDALSDLWS